MDTDEAARAFVEAFQDVYRHTYRRRDPRARHPGRHALAMLQHLAEAGPLTVTEAAAHLDRSQSSVTGRIDRLIARGLLARVADERDRRRHLVWVTDAGLAFVRDETQVLDPTALSRALARLAPQVRTRLVRSMEALVRACRTEAQEERRDDGRQDLV